MKKGTCSPQTFLVFLEKQGARTVPVSSGEPIRCLTLWDRLKFYLAAYRGR